MMHEQSNDRLATAGAMALLHAAPAVTASIGKDPHAGGSGVTVLGVAV